MSDLRRWLEAEFAKAQEDVRLARLAANSRRQEGRGFVAVNYASAVARLVTLGEVMQHLDEPAPRRMQHEPGA
ncbi:hypothetical protein [Dactylosporangium sp. CA-139066]|uniref:hypothetical protein n=1 Tax=Dactylosporangium sp. CA-139066 TaxID=3239930 RepID=UPI003D8EDE9E